MPTINRPITVPGGDSVEFLETSAMTNGRYVKMLATSPPGAIRVPPHIHRRQEESFAVQTGRLTYRLGNEPLKTVAAGENLVLPAGVSHEHWNAESEPLVIIWTVSPGLDFDYLLENANNLAIEGKIREAKLPLIQGLVWVRKMKSTFYPAGCLFGCFTDLQLSSLLSLIFSVTAPSTSALAAQSGRAP
jgi:quercetin dioxygenase-like cupin family protein